MANRAGLYGLRPANPNAPIRNLRVAATQTFKLGDPLILSSGLVAIGTITSAEFIGVAAQDQTTPATSSYVPVWHRDDTEFIIMADADSSATTAGSELDISGSTGEFLLDVSNSTYDVLTVIRPFAQDTLTDAYARWLVKINKHGFSDQS